MRWTLAIVSLLLIAGFIFTVFTIDPKGDASHENALFRPAAPAKIVVPGLVKSADRLAAELREKEKNLAHEARARAQAGKAARGKPISIARPDGRALSIGFYANWDDASFPALKRDLQHLDWIMPGWLALTGTDMALTPDIDQKALDFIIAEKPGTVILPMIQNSVEGKWDGEGLARMLADSTLRAARIDEIVQFIGANGFQGLTIDFETVPPTAQKDLQTFLAELSRAFEPHGWIIALAVPFDDDNWDYAAYADIADYLVLMAYDEHWEEGTPGSIASQDWYEDLLDKRMKDLDENHTIIAIGSYGYDWVNGRTAADVTFQDAVLSANDSEADIDFDAETENPHFSYTEDDGERHQVWFLDAVTAFNQIHAADVYRPAGYALWRLGSEDPSIWSVLGRPYDAPAPDDLDKIVPGDDVAFNGFGEILHITSVPAEGSRTFEKDSDTGDVIDETYTQVPTSYVVQRKGGAPRKIALTFDDGPDPVWTPEILDILKEKNVKATFFVIGEHAAASPDLIDRIIAEGHEVGNHTYTHPNISLLPDSVAQLELNATQRLFESITGRSMRLFRPPYFGDAEPTSREEIRPIELAQNMGYVTVGLRVDPDDWKAPPAEQIVKDILQQAGDPNPEVRGQIVLLHDSGGDRSQTVEALPHLIDALRANNYELVSVGELAGLTPEEVMPHLPGGVSSVTRWVDGAVFSAFSWTSASLSAIFTLAIWLGIGRLVTLCGLGLVNARQDAKRVPPVVEGDALITVLIPAFNEEKVIGASIDRILKSAHGAIELIVIDDGSADKTSDVVRARAESDNRITLVTIDNHGKAYALNQGLAIAKGAVIVALDADTQFPPETLGQLVRWFADPKVGAVAGNAKVGNRTNVVTRWQALEYITAQNLERRALAALDCITVVPGAVGAWRREVLIDLGGFPRDTLAEDQDMTIAVQKAGHCVLFDSEAIAWTEAPTTWGGLAKQRFRWAYGTLQCLWKHRDAMFRSRYGMLGLFALPQVWIFQFLFAMVSPFVDLLLIWQIVATGIDYLQHGNQFDSSNVTITAIYFVVFIVVDLLAAAIAFAMERGENWRLMWWLIPQRFGYRQLVYYVALKAVGKALTGPLIGWGKIERTASITR